MYAYMFIYLYALKYLPFTIIYKSILLLIYSYSYTYFYLHIHTPTPIYVCAGWSGPGVLRLRVHPARRGGAEGARRAGRGVLAVYDRD